MIGSVRRSSEQLHVTSADLDGVTDAVFHLPGQMLIVIDQEHKMLDISASSLDLVGRDPADLRGASLFSLVHEADGAVLTQLIAEAVAGHGEDRPTGSPNPPRIRLLDGGGSVHWATATVAGVDRKGQRAAAVVSLVSAASTAGHAGASMPRHLDPTTGLMNRTALSEALGAETVRQFSRRGQTAVLNLDLDGFKEINEQFGHSVGDRILREISFRLLRVLRKQDHCGRLGGDEFAMVLTEVHSVDEVEAQANRLLEEIHRPVETSARPVTISASIGIAIGPDDGMSAPALLRAADIAMCSAKQAGGNRSTFFHKQLNEAAQRRAQLRQDLADALRENTITPFYQPIVRLGNKSIWGFEALARLKQGAVVIPAAQFIPVALETGQIRAIGHTMLDKIAVDLPHLQQAHGEPIKVALNLTANELDDTLIRRHLLQTVERVGAHSLAVEVTEATMLDPDSAAVQGLRELRDLGVELAVDDFGTGYSNYVALELIKPDVLKADRSFVTQVGQGDAQGRTILHGICTLGKSVGAEVLAEGVETETEESAVLHLGIDLVQGYRYAKPLPLDEALTWRPT